MFSVGLSYVLRGWFNLRFVAVGVGLLKLVQAWFRVCSERVKCWFKMCVSS